MTISIFDLFSIGIGPSSSHTVGPMKAAYHFVHSLSVQQLLKQTHSIQVELYGSLALTGKGHGTDTAILNGLEGQWPATVEPDQMVPRAQVITSSQSLNLMNAHTITFNAKQDIIFHYKELLPLHTNGMRFTALDLHHHTISTHVFYSIGGGFIITPEEITNPHADIILPYPFTSAEELLDLCNTHQLSISDIMLANEKALHPEYDIDKKILEIANVMEQCIKSNCVRIHEIKTL